MSAKIIPAPEDFKEVIRSEYKARNQQEPYKLTVFPKTGGTIMRYFANKRIAMDAFA